MISGRYTIGELIGEGSFGKVYVGESLRSGTKVAIKADEVHGEKTTLAHEAKIMNYLRGPEYIPVLRYYGVDDESRTAYLVMNLLGKSLEDVKRDGGPLKPGLAITIGLQCIRILRYMHSKSIIHRDVKPDNFLFGLGDRTLSVIDFGLSKKYVDSAGKHMARKEDKSVVGTVRYVSARVQRGVEASRRDDIVSLGYMLVYLQTDKLPWQGVRKPPLLRDREIRRVKEQTSSSTLCMGLDDCFAHLLLHGKSLAFDEEPAYARLEARFADARRARAF